MLECFTFVPKLYFGSNTYILHSNGEYCVIDPSVSYTAVSEKLGDIAKCVKYIILTHCHFDHIFTLDEWIEKTCITPIMSPEASENIKSSYVNCYSSILGSNKSYLGSSYTVFDNDTLPFADTNLQFIMTPGHTDGSLSVLVGGYAFVGDTLFAGGSYGRYDLPTGDRDALKNSIARILALDPNIKIMPGHGEPTTVIDAIGSRYL